MSANATTCRATPQGWIGRCHRRGGIDEVLDPIANGLEWAVLHTNRVGGAVTRKHPAYVVAAPASLVAGVATAATLTFQSSGTVTYRAPMAAPRETPIIGTDTNDKKAQPQITYKRFADYQISAIHKISALVGAHTITTDNFGVSVWIDFEDNIKDVLDASGNTVVLDGTSFWTELLAFDSLARQDGEHAGLASPNNKSLIPASEHRSQVIDSEREPALDEGAAGEI
jgi:hypothetical protein